MASVVLWRRNATELAVLQNQAAPSLTVSPTLPSLPPGAELALIEEKNQTRPMTTRDLQGIEAKNLAALKKNPLDPELHLQAAVTLSLKQQFDAAADQLETAARLAPRNAKVRGAAGNFYERFGDMQAALPHLKAAFLLTPQDLDLVFNLAKAYSARGEQEKTLILVEKAEKIAGNSAEAQEKVAGACTELSLRPNIVKAWRKVLKLQPNNALAMQQLAYYELDGGNLAAAKAMLEKALTIEKQQPGLYALLGTLYVSSAPTSDNLKRAETNLRKALELGNANSATYYYLGKVFQRRNDLTQAAQHMEKAISLDPNYREAHYDLAQIYKAQKRPDEAKKQRETFQKIFQAQNQRNLVVRRCQTSPDNADLQRDLAKLLVNQGDLVSALPHLQKALELRPTWKEVREKLAMLHRAMGRPRMAEKIESQASANTKGAP